MSCSEPGQNLTTLPGTTPLPGVPVKAPHLVPKYSSNLVPKSESQVPPPNPPLFRLSYPSAVMNRQFIRPVNFKKNHSGPSTAGASPAGMVAASFNQGMGADKIYFLTSRTLPAHSLCNLHTRTFTHYCPVSTPSLRHYVWTQGVQPARRNRPQRSRHPTLSRGSCA